MQGVATEQMDMNNPWGFKQGNVCVGHIIQITDEGQPLVDFRGNEVGLVPARSIIDEPFKCDSHSVVGIPVLLVFENGDPTLPIIVGFIRDTFVHPAPSEEVSFPIERPLDISVDDRKMLIEAKEEILLRCGKSSMTVKKDGKILLKGTQILSRASGTNKIKGASVRIN